MKYIFLLVFLSFICSTILAGTYTPGAEDSKYLEHGKNFECVGEISGTNQDNTLYTASGVAIDNHHILTAAHVIKKNKSCFFKISNNKFCVKKIIYHTDFDKNIFGSGDIAIGFIEEDIGLSVYPELYSDNNEAGKVCDIVGFGWYGTFEDGPKLFDFNRRAGTNLIDRIESNILVCSPSRPSEKTLTELEFMICPGDSGGGLFIDNKLAGINSSIFKVKAKPDGKYGTQASHTRIRDYMGWIEVNKSH